MSLSVAQFAGGKALSRFVDDQEILAVASSLCEIEEVPTRCTRSHEVPMKTYKFKAKIETATVGSGGACVYFPYNVEEEFGTRGRVPVKATFDGVPYEGSLVKYGAPQHMLGILKAIREQIGKGPGDIVEVTIEKHAGERKVEIPPDLEKLLRKEKLAVIFGKLSYTHQKEYCRWITEAKRDETRANRLAKTVEMLRGGIKTPDAASR
jgi:hypothetical protein